MELQPGFGSLHPRDLELGIADYRRLGIAEAIESEVPVGGGHKEVSMQVILYGTSYYGHDSQAELLRNATVQLIPPTVLTAQTRDLFASRLNAIGRQHRLESATTGNVGDGLRFATDYMDATIDDRYEDIGGLTRHALLVTGWELDNGAYTLNNARAEAVDAGGSSPIFDLLHGLAVESGGGSIDRTDMLGDVSLSSDALKFPSGWSTSAATEEKHCGMAAEVEDYAEVSGNEYVLSEEYAQVIAIMIARCAHQLGDYNRDGSVQVSGSGCFACNNLNSDPCGQDWADFLADVQSEVLYANWNFDFDANGDPIFDGDEAPDEVLIQNAGIDFSKFFTGALGGCP
jgi:hypothetical protein